MSQTRLGSLVESIVNVLIGFGVGVASQYYIFPLFDIHIPFWTNVEIAVWFTVISIARSYFVRRLFNYIVVFNILRGTPYR
jgi:hypothetical protein